MKKARAEAAGMQRMTSCSWWYSTRLKAWGWGGMGIARSREGRGGGGGGGGEEEEEKEEEKKEEGEKEEEEKEEGGEEQQQQWQ